MPVLTDRAIRAGMPDPGGDPEIGNTWLTEAEMANLHNDRTNIVFVWAVEKYPDEGLSVVELPDGWAIKQRPDGSEFIEEVSLANSKLFRRLVKDDPTRERETYPTTALNPRGWKIPVFLFIETFQRYVETGTPAPRRKHIVDMFSLSVPERNTLDAWAATVGAKADVDAVIGRMLRWILAAEGSRVGPDNNPLVDTGHRSEDAMWTRINEIYPDA